MKKETIKLIITTLLVGIGSFLFTRERMDLLWWAFALTGCIGIAISVTWYPNSKMEKKQ